MIVGDIWINQLRLTTVGEFKVRPLQTTGGRPRGAHVRRPYSLGNLPQRVLAYLRHGREPVGHGRELRRDHLRVDVRRLRTFGRAGHERARRRRRTPAGGRPDLLFQWNDGLEVLVVGRNLGSTPDGRAPTGRTLAAGGRVIEGRRQRRGRITPLQAVVNVLIRLRRGLRYQLVQVLQLCRTDVFLRGRRRRRIW